VGYGTKRRKRIECIGRDVCKKHYILFLFCYVYLSSRPPLLCYQLICHVKRNFVDTNLKYRVSYYAYIWHVFALMCSSYYASYAQILHSTTRAFTGRPFPSVRPSAYHVSEIIMRIKMKLGNGFFCREGGRGVCTEGCAVN
jgi:hypothetical protein